MNNKNLSAIYEDFGFGMAETYGYPWQLRCKSLLLLKGIIKTVYYKMMILKGIIQTVYYNMMILKGIIKTVYYKIMILKGIIQILYYEMMILKGIIKTVYYKMQNHMQPNVLSNKQYKVSCIGNYCHRRHGYLSPESWVCAILRYIPCANASCGV